MLLLQRLQAHDGGEDDNPQYLLRDAAGVELVDGAPVHILDAHVDGAFLEEGAVEVDDVRGHAVVEDDELLQDRRELGLLELQPDFLHRHDDARRTILSRRRCVARG